MKLIGLLRGFSREAFSHRYRTMNGSTQRQR